MPIMHVAYEPTSDASPASVTFTLPKTQVTITATKSHPHTEVTLGYTADMLRRWNEAAPAGVRLYAAASAEPEKPSLRKRIESKKKGVAK